MFSNDLIRSLAGSSDEARLRLSPEDWRAVLEANQGFEEPPEQWKGNAAWGRWILARAPELRAADPARAIELCCGNGFLFFSLRALNGTGRGPLCVDISRTQLRAFRERCARAGLEAPPIVLGDIGRLPVPDGSATLVYGHSFLHHLPDVGHYLREVSRVLVPGGLFIATHEPTPRATRWEDFPRNLWRRPVHDSLTDIWLIRPEIITGLLREAGFGEVMIRPTGRLAAIVANPWQMTAAKLSSRFPGLARLGHGPVVAYVRMAADRIEEALVPRPARLERCPSITIRARK